MITEKLEEIKRAGKLTSFYTDKDNTSRFIVGYIEEISDTFIAISTVNPNGLYDGLLLKELDSIFRVNTDSPYLEKMQILLTYYDQSKERPSLSSNDLLLDFLKYAHKNNYVVSLELLNSGFDDIKGYIDRLDDNVCSIKQITDDGEFNGYSTIGYSDISQISCNSEDEKTPGTLWLLKNK